MRLIDADELYSAIKEASENADFFRAIYDGFLRCIDRSPTIEAKPVIRSEWEITDVDHAYGHKCYHCPECGWDEWRCESTNYCPNCSAKMDGGGSDGKAD